MSFHDPRILWSEVANGSYPRHSGGSERSKYLWNAGRCKSIWFFLKGDAERQQCGRRVWEVLSGYDFSDPVIIRILNRGVYEHML